MANESPWAGCRVCGHAEHTYRHHLDDVEAPEFVHASARRLREIERAGSSIDPLVSDISHLADEETGGRKAWALWLLLLLEELEEAADAPDVAAEIEDFLIEGYSN